MGLQFLGHRLKAFHIQKRQYFLWVVKLDQSYKRMRSCTIKDEWFQVK